MPLLLVLVCLSLVAMSGVFGVRHGAYRKRGFVVGCVLIAVAAVLFISHHVT